MYAGSTGPPQPQACAVDADTRVTTAVAVATSASFPIFRVCWWRELWVMDRSLLNLGCSGWGFFTGPVAAGTSRLRRRPCRILARFLCAPVTRAPGVRSPQTPLRDHWACIGHAVRRSSQNRDVLPNADPIPDFRKALRRLDSDRADEGSRRVGASRPTQRGSAMSDSRGV